MKAYGTGEIGDLELALLRRGVDERVADLERCGRCHRTPLIGESVYFYEREIDACASCAARSSARTPVSSGSSTGRLRHTMRITDQRAAASRDRTAPSAT